VPRRRRNAALYFGPPPSETPIASRYDQPVDPNTPNNAHSFAVKMVGWNQRVLELGAASGHVTRALVAQNCRVSAIEYDADAAQGLKGAADHVMVGDLNDPATLAGYSAEFDVVLAGDVLEHLVDPQAVLNRMAKLIVPTGRIVLSLPNIAHADVKLSLMRGQFEYKSWGLLDRTHLRFFTLKSVRDLVKQGGLLIVALERVHVPAFESEHAIERQTVPTAVVDEALADPESETYQFVLTAVPDNGDYQTAQLSAKYQDLLGEHQRMRIELTQRSLALERERAGRQRAESDVARLLATRLFRYTRGLRKIYRGLRGGEH
jgi:2-polyprenyl-3-methyl-5-hydroxy-6-metoxy-1,4-benzoquinol methylase